MPDLTRAERVEALLAILRSHDVHVKGFEPRIYISPESAHRVSKLLREIDASPPDPQPQTGALRELRDDEAQLVMRDALVAFERTVCSQFDDKVMLGLLRDRGILLAAPAPAEPEPVRRTITGVCTRTEPPGLIWDDIEPEPVADAERERRVAEWEASARSEPVKPPGWSGDSGYPIAFCLRQSEIEEALAIMRDRDAEVARLRAELDAAYKHADDVIEIQKSVVEQRDAANIRLDEKAIDWTTRGGLRVVFPRRHVETGIAVVVQENADLRAELTRLSGQSGSCAECERLTKQIATMDSARLVEQGLAVSAEKRVAHLEAEVARLTAERDAARAELALERGGWDALERLRDDIQVPMCVGWLRSKDEDVVKRWVTHYIDKALAARPQPKEADRGTD